MLIILRSSFHLKYQECLEIVRKKSQLKAMNVKINKDKTVSVSRMKSYFYFLGKQFDIYEQKSY